MTPVKSHHRDVLYVLVIDLHVPYSGKLSRVKIFVDWYIGREHFAEKTFTER